jgi:hypothetical protein
MCLNIHYPPRAILLNGSLLWCGRAVRRARKSALGITRREIEDVDERLEETRYILSTGIILNPQILL